ncbi:MAG: hypothetical protein AAF085_02835 [Planctomycetota bacterium]
MRPAKDKFKEEIEEWLTLENFKFESGGYGSKHVEAAIKRALSYEPQTVFLLSDNPTGGGQGGAKHEVMQDDLMKAIHKTNDA